MLEVTRWVSNLDQYYRNAVVTERALDNWRVRESRFFAQGDRGRKEKCPQFNGIESRSASEAARDFLLEPREARIAQGALRIYDLINKRLFRKTEHSTL